ncbi:MAG: hypothetical protein AAF035_04425 [Pseudomonadota bacterium]
MRNVFGSGVAMMGAFACGLTSVAAGEKAPDWAIYMQSAANVAAIGSGIAMATPCSKPLIFEETVEENTRTVAIHCRGDSEDEFSVFVTFNVVGDVIVPSEFSRAG